MELLNTNVKIRCEMGACKNIAAHSIKLNRVGIKSQIHICDACLLELHNLVADSIEIQNDAVRLEGNCERVAEIGGRRVEGNCERVAEIGGRGARVVKSGVVVNCVAVKKKR